MLEWLSTPSGQPNIVIVVFVLLGVHAGVAMGIWIEVDIQSKREGLRRTWRRIRRLVKA